MEAKADQEFLPALSRTENAIELHVHQISQQLLTPGSRPPGNRPADNTHLPDDLLQVLRKGTFTSRQQVR
jgi:hypothetical protein